MVDEVDVINSANEEIARLGAENERLKKNEKRVSKAYSEIVETLDRFEAENERLEDENERLRKDAERYRKLQAEIGHPMPIMRVLVSTGRGCSTPLTLTESLNGWLDQRPNPVQEQKDETSISKE